MNKCHFRNLFSMWGQENIYIKNMHAFVTVVLYVVSHVKVYFNKNKTKSLLDVITSKNIASCFAIFLYVFNVYAMYIQYAFNVCLNDSNLFTLTPPSRDAIASKKNNTNASLLDEMLFFI